MRVTSPMNTVARPDRYEEVQIDSGGVPVVLSIWHADAPRATVVFLPGTMVHPLFYAEFLDGLAADGLRVVGVHSQGHGKSPRTRAPLTWSALVRNAEDGVAYAVARFPEPVVVLGSSQGGMLATAVAASGLPLAGVIAHNILDPQDPSALRVTRLPGWVAKVQRPLQRLLHLAGALLPRLPVPIGAYLDLRRVCGDRDSLEHFRTDPLALRSYPLRFIASLFDADLSALTDGSLRCPVVVLAATGDPLFPTEDARELAHRIVAPDTRFVTVDLDRHLIFNECVPDVLPVVTAEVDALVAAATADAAVVTAR
jgi:alpha-beta hydrolase superfamily lysophospholipase